MKNIYPFQSKVCPEQRRQLMQQAPQLVWLTGLSGSGKSTLALRLEHYLFHKGYKVYLLDGDNIRNGLCRDLSFSEQDRKENIRRVAEVAKLLLDAGMVVICAFISPYEEERELARRVVGRELFTEVYISCSLRVCEQRDTKGLSARARAGLIQNFPAISAPSRAPPHPDLTLRTDQESIDDSLHKLITLVEPQLRLQQPMKAAM